MGGPIITFGDWSENDQLAYLTQKFQDLAEHPKVSPLVFVQAAMVAACYYADENGVSRDQLVRIARDARLPSDAAEVYDPRKLGKGD